ncbi:MAG: GAF domain-containing protein [Leptospiraceae bacterium]|nr:GAF domain-containing protein [Leptospiraceae bacterium]
MKLLKYMYLLKVSILLSTLSTGLIFISYKKEKLLIGLFIFFSLFTIAVLILYDNVFFKSFHYFYHFLSLLMSFGIVYRFGEWKKDSLTQMEKYSNEYKSELDKVTDDLKNYKKTFEQKILDKSYHLVTYMERLEIQTEEMEKLNELIVSLLEGSNIDSVLDGIFQHILTYYKADIAFLYFIDHNTNEFYAHRGKTKNIPAEIKDFMMKSRMKINKEAGLSYIAYKRKRTVYLENTKTKFLKNPEKAYEIQLPELLSQIYIPIIIRGEFQGIFFLASFNKSMKLNKDKLKYVSMFSNQLAIALQKETIMKEMQEAKIRAEQEREKATISQQEAESAREEIEAINSLAKSINENLETKVIMSKIMSFVEARYGIKYFSLYTINERKTKLKHLDSSFPFKEEVNNPNNILKIQIPLKETIGVFEKIYNTGKIIYFKRINPDNSSTEEKEIFNNINLYSMIGVPLKVKKEIIGILSFYCADSNNLSKNELKTIVNLSELVAGVINNSNLHSQVQTEKDKSENLLLSILPPKIADELKKTGKIVPVIYDSSTILFTDFVGFTGIAETLMPEQLLIELDGFFTYFDFICEKYNMEKLKTIGDSYMCAGGLPIENFTHPIDSCLAALDFRDFALRMKELAVSSEGKMIPWELRIGLHTGPVIGGIVGTKKFTYDVWGDAVNTASRIESSGLPGKINISGEMHKYVGYFFDCEYRGKVGAKNKGTIDMYFLNRLKPEFSSDSEGLVPNEAFQEIYEKVKLGEINLKSLLKEKLVSPVL